jgi:Right handed beta helix region
MNRMMFLRLSPVALAMVALLTTGATAQAQQRGAMPVTGTVTGATVTIPTANVVSLFVDSSYTGSTSDGGANTPYKTITAATMKADLLNMQSKNVRVRIKPGNGYREKVDFFRQALTKDNFTVTFEGYLPTTSSPRPTLFGSDRWMGNTFGVATTNNGSPIYYRSGGTPWGIQYNPWPGANEYPDLPDVMRRRETVTIGDQPLKRVLSYGELVPGTFFVQESNAVSVNYGKYYICPPAGVIINASTAVEVGMRKSVFNVTQRKNLIFKDLNMQGCADYFNDGALHTSQCVNVSVENCGFAYNCSKGMVSDNGIKYTVSNSSFYKNGITGCSGGYMENLLIKNVTITNNNWRGARGVLDRPYNSTVVMGAWDNAGIKLFQVHNLKIQDSYISDNVGDCAGIWLDTDIKDATVSNTQCLRNNYGVFYEAAQGPCLITNCNLSNNRTAGVYASSGDNLTVSGCLVGNNGALFYDDANPDAPHLTDDAQIYILGNTIGLPIGTTSGGRAFIPVNTVIDSGSTLPVQVPLAEYIAMGRRFTFTNNKIYWNDINQNYQRHLLIGYQYGDSAGFSRFQTTLTATGNQYWHPTDLNGFHRLDGTQGPLAQWKLDSGTDNNAIWTPL